MKVDISTDYQAVHVGLNGDDAFIWAELTSREAVEELIKELREAADEAFAPAPPSDVKEA